MHHDFIFIFYPNFILNKFLFDTVKIIHLGICSLNFTIVEAHVT